MRVVFGADGLAPAIVQDRLTGEVRMLGWVDAAALEATARSGRMTFYSRSRKRLWEKGETSGNALRVARLAADCDGDAVLAEVDPAGPTCHTGASSCFFRPLDAAEAGDGGAAPAPYLVELERVIEARKAAAEGTSYTRDLIAKGPAKIGEKLREEADELARAIAGESDARVASEAADVLFHLMVGLASRGLSLRDAVAALAARAGVSGHTEKAHRRG
ncbi:MAG TPA: bifunctional phosphoribosyl-AMP cyclohydrolase/phosphoribosyl-ATP diphosphatase HisIE [Minicystis sp.]|nr:bifunctional phosphoribosyl-AMP cyclohydrolase/phosphoribosyl-ATP diphosphatase HisIE [Minicystis sp.]